MELLTTSHDGGMAGGVDGWVGRLGGCVRRDTFLVGTSLSHRSRGGLGGPGATWVGEGKAKHA